MSARDFPRFIGHVRFEEGGYSSPKHSPNDWGKETYRGISRKSWPTWVGWPVIDARKRRKPIKWNEVLPQLEPDVDAFYKYNFFDRYGGPVLPWASFLPVVDWFINSGASRVIVRKVQSLTDTTVDGLYGPATIAAIADETSPLDFGSMVCDRRLRVVRSIAARNPSQTGNLKVWEARIKRVRESIGDTA